MWGRGQCLTSPKLHWVSRGSFTSSTNQSKANQTEISERSSNCGSFLWTCCSNFFVLHKDLYYHFFLVENMASKCVANRTDIDRRMDRHGGSSNETIHHTKIDVNIAHSVRLSASLFGTSATMQPTPPATSNQPPATFIRPIIWTTNHHHIHIHIPKCYGVCIFKAFINLPIWKTNKKRSFFFWNHRKHIQRDVRNR